MNNGFIGSFTCIALLLLALAPAAGAVSVAETVQAAVERHPQYPLHQALRKVESGYRQQAESFFGGDPSLDLSAAGDSLGSDFGYGEYTVGVSVPVWLPGQREARRMIADNLATQSELELSRLTWEVAGEVLKRAWQLRIAQAGVKQALKQWAAARALEKDVIHRFEAGELTRNDLLLAQQDLVETASAYQEALNQQQQANLSWHNYTGLQELPEDLELFAQAQAQVAPALPQHPQLRAALAQAQTAQARVNDTRMQRRAAPVVSVYAKRDRGVRNEAYTDSLGIELSIPLGARSHAAPAIAEAEAELTGAESEAALLKRQLDLRIANAEQELHKASQLLHLAQQKNEFAHARLRLSQRAFELGEMDLYQLLLARQQAAVAARDLEIRQLNKLYAMTQKNHLLGVIPQ
ncbi:TolC family protein [Thiolapillus sp.]